MRSVSEVSCCVRRVLFAVRFGTQRLLEKRAEIPTFYREVSLLKKGLAIVVFVVGIITMLCGAAATTMGAVGLSSRR